MPGWNAKSNQIHCRNNFSSIQTKFFMKIANIFPMFAFHLPDKSEDFSELLPQRVTGMQRPSKGWARLFMLLLALACGSIVCNSRATLNRTLSRFFFGISEYFLICKHYFVAATFILPLHLIWQICRAIS